MRPSISMARILSARTCRSVSSPQGLTSQMMRDLAMGAAFLALALPAAVLALRASAAAASASGSASNRSSNSSSAAAGLAASFLAPLPPLPAFLAYIKRNESESRFSSSIGKHANFFVRKENSRNLHQQGQQQRLRSMSHGQRR